jgi:hypothetical protein
MLGVHNGKGTLSSTYGTEKTGCPHAKQWSVAHLTPYTKIIIRLSMVAHAYISSYSGGDQEDQSSSPIQAESL